MSIQCLNDSKVMVCGVGGAGCNLVATLSAKAIPGVSLLATNTDLQSLNHMPEGVDRVLLGEATTKGLGAGASPESGRLAVQETATMLLEQFRDVDLVFLSAGMGGGTGTGGAPLVASLAREAGALVVAVVTTPFPFEGHKRNRVANAGVAELTEVANSIMVLPNERLLDIEDQSSSISDTFACIDEILAEAVAGMIEIVTVTGEINIDFAGVRSVLEHGSRSIISQGEADTAVNALKIALQNPIIGVSPAGAFGCILNVVAGEKLAMQDFAKASEMLSLEADPDALILAGCSISPYLGDKVRVTVIATQISASSEAMPSFSSLETPYVPTLVAEELEQDIDLDAEEDSLDVFFTDDVLPLAEAALPREELNRKPSVQVQRNRPREVVLSKRGSSSSRPAKLESKAWNLDLS